MKIAIIGKFYTEGFGLHIQETLITMGHDVVPIDPEAKFLQYNFLGQKVRNITKTLYQQIFYKIPAVRNFKTKSICKIYQKEKIDLSIVVHDYFTSQDIESIKKINTNPICIWFPDAISNFQKSMFFTAGYDYLFFKDKYVVNKLKNEYNLNAHYLPQCCNPKRHKITDLSDIDIETYGCEITNVGNLYPSRAALYRQLSNYHLKMWGSPPAIWLKMPELKKAVMGRIVFNDEKSKAFRAAKIVLNNMHLAEINGVNKRTFEIPACGGFQIVTHNDAVNELFEIGKEIITYTDFKDLKTKIDYFLDPKNENERQSIINAGHQRAIKDHTYENRLKTIITTCRSSR
jgi:spore maturation protein CgeB